jgi:autotransporter-associated beta strand protein
LQALDGVGLPAASNLTLTGGGILSIEGSVTFNRSPGTGPGQIQWTGSGGFSAYGGKFTVNLGGQATPGTLVWGAADFLPDGAQLLLNAKLATGEVELRNPLDLGGGARSILVTDNSNSTTDLATLSGGLSNDGITKEGDGTLVLAAAGSYTGPTTVNNGILRCTVSGALGAGSSIVINKAPQGTTTLDPGATNQTASSLTLVDGSITGTTGVLTVAGNVDARKGTISAALAGACSLTKTTVDLATLSGINTYSGTTTVAAGALRANEGAGLSPNSNLVLAGGVLEGSGTASFTRSLGTGQAKVQRTAAGGFSAYTGKLTVNIGGNATPDTLVWGNPFFVPDGANLIFGSSSSTQTVESTNPIDLGGAVRTVTVNRNPDGYSNDLANLTGGLSNGALTKTGPGTLVLSGSNTYSGPTLVKSGTLRAGSAGAVAGSSDLTIADDGSNPSRIATFDISSANPVATSVTLVNGSIIGTTGVLSATSYDLRKGTVSGKLGGSGGVTKTTADSVTLSGASSYTGPTVVSEGTLVVANDTALGIADAGTTVALGATLSIQSAWGALEPLTLSGSGVAGAGCLKVDNGNNEWAGPITFADDCVIGSGNRLALKGPVGDGGTGRSLTKIGTGVLVLAGTNTYSGATIITQGSIQAVDGVGLPPASNLVLAGGTLLPDGTTPTFTRAVGPGPGQVQWTSSGGFSAGTSAVTINLGGNATPETSRGAPAVSYPTAALSSLRRAARAAPSTSRIR